MDIERDPMSIKEIIWITGTVGLLVGLEARHHLFEDRDWGYLNTRRWLSTFGLIFFAANASDLSHSWSGFFYCLFMPIGAYKFAEYVGWWVLTVMQKTGWIKSPRFIEKH